MCILWFGYKMFQSFMCPQLVVLLRNGWIMRALCTSVDYSINEFFNG